MERVLLFFTLLLLPLSGMTQTYRSKDIDSLLRVADWDTIQKIELLASYEFHQLLNDYRTSNNRNALKWSKHLWLASRNHCQWMKSNSKLGHVQMKSTTNFTGATPGDRMFYIGKGKAIGACSGENALYNYLYEKNSDSINIKSIAKHMAEESFSSWRSSSPHNKNMLSDHVSEGTAFIIDHNGKYWGVSLFAYSNCEGEWIWSQNGASNPVNLKNELSPFDLKLLEDDIMEELQRASNQKMDIPLSKAAAHHSNYLMRSNTLTHEQSKIKRYYFGKTPEKRLIKTTKGIFWIKKPRNLVVESICKIETASENARARDICQEMMIGFELNKNHTVDASNGTVGYGVTIRQKNGTVFVYGVRLQLKKKSDL